MEKKKEEDLSEIGTNKYFPMGHRLCVWLIHEALKITNLFHFLRIDLR